MYADYDMKMFEHDETFKRPYANSQADSQFSSQLKSSLRSDQLFFVEECAS